VTNTLAAMADLKPAYLVHGDDQVKLDAWRGRLRSRALNEAPDATLDVLTDDQLNADALVAATYAMTLSSGRHYVLADGIESFDDGEAKQVAAAIGDLAPDTTVVMIASGAVKEGKGPAPAKIVKAVEKAGGEVHLCGAPGGRELRGWATERASGLGKKIDREAVALLIDRAPKDRGSQVRKQSLARELEKLATYVGERDGIDAEDVEAVAASDADPRAFQLADAIVAGDRSGALRIAEELRAGGEDPMPVLFTLRTKVRDTRYAWAAVSGGATAQDVQSRMKVPPWIAKRIYSAARNADGELLERASDELADWDWAIRGGSDLDPWMALTLALRRTLVAETRP
jgi:DNA polymerase-3 subunit delta